MLKKLIKYFLYPIGSTARILAGPLKGFRFIISENSGWSPVMGGWEPESQYLFTRLIRKGQTVYDLGANNGIHTLLFSKLVGAKGKIIAFEPIPENMDEIRNNCRINKLANVTIAGYAVGHLSGTTEFKLGIHNKQGSLSGIGRESGKTIEVQTITLDDFIEQGNPPPDFIKMDIEGAESDALSGFRKLFSKILPVLIVELHTPEQDRKVGKFLSAFGYSVYRVQHNSDSPDLKMRYLKKIERLDIPWPDPSGIWGTILAFHPSKNPV